MMISHSPPIFSHSPPVSFLSEFRSTQHLPCFPDDQRGRFCRPQALTLASRAIANNANSQVYRGRSNGIERMSSAPELLLPPKSCIRRSQTDNHAKESPCAKNTNESRLRKKVIFADDEGLSLTEVRVMSEPSNVPPYWSVKFLEQITQGLVSPHPADQWAVDFKQPASDYLSFRQKIERDYVCLENVIVKDDESLIVGTVKVKNTNFEKEVIVRVTWDDWKTQQDVFCSYARTYGPTAAYVIFDTFSFKITLPPTSKRLEFCICYRTAGKEYWDNNETKNYTITKRSPFYYHALAPYEPHKHNNQFSGISKLSSALSQTESKYKAEEPSPYY